MLQVWWDELTKYVSQVDHIMFCGPIDQFYPGVSCVTANLVGGLMFDVTSRKFTESRSPSWTPIFKNYLTSKKFDEKFDVFRTYFFFLFMTNIT